MDQHTSGVRALVGISALAVAASMLAACSGSSDGHASAPPSSATTTLTTLTPKGGGKVASITWDLFEGEPTSLDFVKAGNYSPDEVVANLCDNLLRLNPDYTTSPGLATSVEQPDNTHYVYTIRQGVHFTDGKPLTAEDVAFSLNRNLDPTQEPVNGTFYANVKSIAVTGTDKVTVTLKSPDELFNAEMATVAGAVGEKAYIQKAGRKYGTPSGGVMCTGPYELASWQAGEQIVLKAKPDYWDTSLVPQVQQATFKFITDSSALTNALLAGTIDGTYEAPIESVQQLEKTKRGRMYYGPSLQILSLYPAGTGMMANAKIRQALSLVIDRENIVKAVYGGAAVPLKAYTPPSGWGYGKSVFQAAYDTLPSTKPDAAAATKLVKDAGSPKGSINMAILEGDSSQLKVATIIQAEAQQIGLDVKITPLPGPSYSNFFYVPSARKGIDLALTAGYMDIPDPLDILNLLVKTGAAYNYIGYSNKAVDAALEQAQSTSDEATRAAEIVKAQELLTKDAFPISLLSPNERLFMNARITGAPATFAYIFTPWLAMVGAS